MATPAQVAANRANSQSSTGPKTADGKLRVSDNAIQSGLFSKRNCVAPADAPEYEALRAGLWATFNPQNPAEELFVSEIVRAAWRLQRCAQTEESLLDLNEEAKISAIQTSVDRARTQASGVLNRNMEQLRKLQTERWCRLETLPKEFDGSKLGLASSSQILNTLHTDAHRKVAEMNVNEKIMENKMAAFMSAVPAGFSPYAETPGAKQSQFGDRPETPGAKQSQSEPAEPLRRAA
jgi:hypothetical protein